MEHAMAKLTERDRLDRQLNSAQAALTRLRTMAKRLGWIVQVWTEQNGTFVIKVEKKHEDGVGNGL